MTTQHTPGPWQCDDCLSANGFTTINRADDTPHGNTDEQPVATVYADADACLIAAAPDLLAALRDIVDLQGKTANGLPLSENEVRDWAVANHTARAAIAKAEGL